MMTNLDGRQIAFIYWLYMLGELLTSLIISSLICQTVIFMPA